MPNCPHCRSPRATTKARELIDIEYRAQGTFDVLACQECGFHYLSPLPPNSRRVGRYPENYYTQSQVREGWLHSRLLKIRYFLRWRRIRRYAATPIRTFVEVGCGDGRFLEFLEAELKQTEFLGIDAFTQEFPPCRRVRWVSDPIDQVVLPQNTDVIALYDTLEHLPDVLSTLKRLRKSLSSEGVLVGTIPVWGSLWHSLFPRHWQGLSIPRHLSFFDPLTLRQVLKQAGLELVTLKPILDPGDLSVTAANWIVDRFRLSTPPRQAWFFFPLTLVAIPLELLRLAAKKSGQMEFVARRAVG